MAYTPDQFQEFWEEMERLDRKAKELNACIQKFMQSAKDGVKEIIFEQYPELIPHKNVLLEPILKEMDFHLDMLVEYCDRAWSGFVVDPESLVVFRQEKTDFEAEMAKARSESHEYGTAAEFFVEETRICLIHEIARENFTYRCQQRVKQAVYESFPDVQNFYADSLRMIEYSINLFLSEFCVGFFYLTDGYRYSPLEEE